MVRFSCVMAISVIANTVQIHARNWTGTLSKWYPLSCPDGSFGDGTGMGVGVGVGG